MRKGHTMPKWNLMRLARVADGTYALEPLTEEQELFAPYYEMILTRAAESDCSDPKISGYHVKGCAAVGELTIARCGNREYARRAFHTEAAAVAALASLQNSVKNPVPPVLALIAGYGRGALETLTMPCGDCRDILRDTVGKSCILVLGTLDGGTAVVMTLADTLFEDFARVPLDRIDVMETTVVQVVQEGTRLMRHHRPLERSARNYVVALTTGEGLSSNQTYFGATSNRGAFHPICPIEDAVRAAERDSNPYVRSVIVAAEGDGSVPPDVDYRDRQCLLEFAIDRELLTGKRYDPPVRLFTHANGKLTGAWKTSAEEWLPLPFSPRNFGSEFLAGYTAYLKKKYGR